MKTRHLIDTTARGPSIDLENTTAGDTTTATHLTRASDNIADGVT